LGDLRTVPLFLLAKINAIDLTFNTWQYHRAKDSDWKKMSATQHEIIRQVEKWLTV